SCEPLDAEAALDSPIARIELGLKVIQVEPQGIVGVLPLSRAGQHVADLRRLPLDLAAEPQPVRPGRIQNRRRRGRLGPELDLIPERGEPPEREQVGDVGEPRLALVASLRRLLTENTIDLR